MAEVVIARIKPKPDEVETFELPGAGLYEVDLGIPGWLVPDAVINREFEVQAGLRKVKHIRSVVSGNLLTTRLRIADPEPQTLQDNSPAVAVMLGGVAVATVLRAVLGVALGALGVWLVSELVRAIREIRKIAEVPAGGFALAAVGLGVLAFAGSKLVRAAKS